jgi:DNA-binding PadR family transcriptional regulator
LATYSDVIYIEVMNTTTHDKIIPLTPQQLQIMVALALGPATGYDVRRQVEGDTQANMKLASGSVYPALKRLRQLCVIQAIADRPYSPLDVSSRVYELTQVGEQVLEWELERIERAAELGRERLEVRMARRRTARRYAR